MPTSRSPSQLLLHKQLTAQSRRLLRAMRRPLSATKQTSCAQVERDLRTECACTFRVVRFRQLANLRNTQIESISYMVIPGAP